MEVTAIARSESWNLSDLFPDDAGFERAKTDFKNQLLPSVDRYRSRLAESHTILAEALDTLATATKQLQLLHCYASLKSDQDTRVATYQAMRQEIEMLATELSRRAAYVRPEILAMDQALLDDYVAREPRLGPHAHFLKDLFRQRAHILEPGEERIIAETGLLTRGPSSLYQILINAELPRPEVELAHGERIRLTPVTFQSHRSTRIRSDRLAIFPSYYASYGAFRETLGQNLYAALKTHVFHARARVYDSSLLAALSSDNVPQGVYRNLIGQVRKHLPILHRYFRERARRLRLERLEYPDLYCPLSGTPARHYSTEETRRLIVEGLAALGPDYGRAVDAAFASRWIDWHPAPGKRAGAYVTGRAYDSHPFVLLNYTGDYESLLTVAHEIGHAMHSHYSNASQPYPTADYSIFVAEVASTLNELLLLRHMLSQAQGEERLFLLGRFLDGIRGTLFRQGMFAEFELELHERAERGEALTGERLSQMYLRLLREYCGHEQGVVYVADDYAVEWAAIPHLYYNFYVYQYATGIIAATALSRGVLESRPGAREHYLEFLRAGGSDYPLDLLRRAGVDLETSQSYEEAFAAIAQHVEQLERCPDLTEQSLRSH